MTTRRKLLRSASGAVAAGVVGGALLNTGQPVAAQSERSSELASTADLVCLVTVVGTSQGPFDRETNLVGWENAFIGLGHFTQVGMPRDAAGKVTSGKFLHQPITITKEWGAASPQLLQALVTNEVLSTVKIEFVRFIEGEYGVLQEITLVNATIVDIEQFRYFNAAGHQTAHFPQLFEDVSFTFQTITVKSFPGEPEGRTVTYNWSK